MQENHSFDNYFGALAYALGSPYHSGLFGCRKEDHDCVDGLICGPDKDGGLRCYNANRDDNGTLVSAFHDTRRCAAPRPGSLVAGNARGNEFSASEQHAAVRVERRLRARE
jgi:hypothetical protein